MALTATMEKPVEIGAENTADGMHVFFSHCLEIVTSFCFIEVVEFTKLIKDLKAKIIDMKNQLKPLKQK